MTSRKEDNLFALVHSLSAIEERHFRRFANLPQKKPEKLIELFDEVKSLDTYNEPLLKQKFRNLPVSKFKLKQLIMAGLRVQHEGSIEVRVIEHLQNSQILYDKGLYIDSRKSLRDATELANKYEKWHLLTELSRIEKHRIQESERRNLNEMILNSIHKDETIWAIASRENQIIAFYHSIFASYRESGNISDDWEEKIAFLKSVHSEDSFWSRFYANQALGIWERTRGNFSDAKKMLQKNLVLWDENHNLKQEMIGKYKILLFNLAMYHIGLGELGEAQLIRDKVLKIEDRSENEKAESFQNLASLDLLLVLNSGNYAEAKPLERWVVKGLEQFGKKLNAARRFSICYNLMILVLINEDYKKSWYWLQEIISNKKFNIRKEVHYSARLLQLIMFYELEYWDPPDSVLIRTYRYLSRKDQLTEFKKSVLKYISKLSSAAKSDKPKILQEMKDKLILIFDSEQSKSDRLGLQVVLGWVMSKLENRPISEILPFP